MKYTLTEARAELRALKSCSADEAAANYSNWMKTYMERIVNTTGKVYEIYLQCAKLLQDKADGYYEDRYEDNI